MVNANGIANRGEAEGRRRVLGVLTFCHLVNDYYFMVIPPLLPFLARDFQLTFFQSGLLVFIINIVSAFLQPVIGYFSDLKMLRRFVIVIGLLVFSLSFIALGVVPYYVILLIVLVAAAATCCAHTQVRDPQQTLDRPLPDCQVLHVGEGQRYLTHRHDALADAQAAVRHDVPAHLVVQPDHHVGQGRLDE